jgi:DNA-binding MarR family transcriptional regulator
VVPLDAGCQVRLAQARIFQRIGRDGSRLAELAQVTKQTAGALVDQLEAAGHVERRPDPSDKGARLVCISDLGAKARAVWMSRDTHIGPLSSNLARSVILPTWLAQDHDREARCTSEGAARAGLGPATSRHRSGQIPWRRSPRRQPRGPAPTTTGGHNFAIQSGPRRSAAVQWADLPVTGQWTAELNRVQGEWATESPTRTARQPGSSARMSGLSISR